MTASDRDSVILSEREQVEILQALGNLARAVNAVMARLSKELDAWLAAPRKQQRKKTATKRGRIVSLTIKGKVYPVGPKEQKHAK